MVSTFEKGGVVVVLSLLSSYLKYCDNTYQQQEELLPPAVGMCWLVGWLVCVLFVWFVNEWSFECVLLRREYF